MQTSIRLIVAACEHRLNPVQVPLFCAVCTNFWWLWVWKGSGPTCIFLAVHSIMPVKTVVLQGQLVGCGEGAACVQPGHAITSRS